MLDEIDPFSPYAERNVFYIMLLRRFEDFDGTAYAMFTVVMKLVSLFGLFIIVPFVSGRLKLHESAMLSVITFMTIVSYLAAGEIMYSPAQLFKDQTAQ